MAVINIDGFLLDPNQIESVQNDEGQIKIVLKSGRGWNLTKSNEKRRYWMRQIEKAMSKRKANDLLYHIRNVLDYKQGPTSKTDQRLLQKIQQHLNE